MVRIEFTRAIRDELASWGIPGDTFRQFYLNLDDHRWTIEFLEALEPLGNERFEYISRVPETTAKVYHFVLRLDRLDELHFRVVQCSAYATDGAGRMLWSSP